ncbi:MAG: aquaporin [Phycisphaerales bacterium]|jgi:aquaporin Z
MPFASAAGAFRAHWPEYLIEGALLGGFMLSACLATVACVLPSSPLAQALPNPLLQRTLIGLAMGFTAIGLIYSPWGKRSGAHMNPAVTIAFAALGKVKGWDAAFYIMSQFVGGAAGVLLSWLLVGHLMAAPEVGWVVTVPGPDGVGVAFAAEVAISFGLFLAVLFASNRARLAPYTGIIAGILVASYIVVEAPFSGMSMNPARSMATAVVAGNYRAMWLYFTAPPLAMLLAAGVYTVVSRECGVKCAKLHHVHGVRCIFRCGWCRHEQPRAGEVGVSSLEMNRT